MAVRFNLSFINVYVGMNGVAEKAQTRYIVINFQVLGGNSIKDIKLRFSVAPDIIEVSLF
jgi:hypothetical protein